MPVRRPRTIVVPALAVVLLAALDLTVIAPILPRMLTDLNINTAEADRYVWIVTGYLIAYTLTIPLLGRFSDIFGRRNAFLVALGVFLVGSVLCAMAHSLPILIAARVIQGFGGGAMLPISMALVGDVLPPENRAAGARNCRGGRHARLGTRADLGRGFHPDFRHLARRFLAECPDRHRCRRISDL